MTAGTHDPALVALSVLIATVASYTALDLAGRIRASSGVASMAWLVTAAIAMGGGIWSMHFIGMQAIELPGMTMHYDTLLTLVSLFAPIIVTGTAFFVVDKFGVERLPLVASGLLMGASIVAMHYTGMAAMLGMVTSYDPVWVVVSIVIAIGAATAALALAFRNAGLPQRALAAVAMGLAVSGMHYSAMQGATFSHIDGAHHGHLGPALEQGLLAIAIAAATFVILMIALVAAMIDRRFAQLAAREAETSRVSEERYKTLLRSLSDYAIFRLDRDGAVASWNSGAEKIFGYGDKEIVGRRFGVFYDEEEKSAGAQSVALSTAFVEGKFKTESWRVRKDGSRFWANVVMEAIRDAEGEIEGFAVVTRDVSDRREAQLALQEAQATLAQAQKMESIGQLTGGVAHDFNNLLTIIIGSMELLQKRTDDPKLQRLADNAYQAAQRGALLTQRMLAFARKQELRPAPVDVPELVRGMADLLQRTIGPTVQIETRFPLHLTPARVDPNQLEMALMNLAVNAHHAMPAGGVITIGAREVASEETGAPKRFVCLSVTDTGEGMDETTLAKAKEPFFTTKEIGKGTGLGLSMIHGLAEQSSGRLVLKSKLGEGTTAEIWLPVAEAADGPTQAELRKLAEDTADGALLVLAVDDDHLVLMNTAAMLEELGHRVVQASSAEMAIEILSRTDDIGMLITDHAMPGMTGIQLLERVKAERPTLPTLLVTGYAELPTEALRSLVKLDKPFRQHSLATAISTALAASDGDGTVIPFRREA